MGRQVGGGSKASGEAKGQKDMEAYRELERLGLSTWEAMKQGGRAAGSQAGRQARRKAGRQGRRTAGSKVDRQRSREGGGRKEAVGDRESRNKELAAVMSLK